MEIGVKKGVTRINFQRIFIGLFFFGVDCLSLSAQIPTDIRPLLPNQPIERELKGDQVHSYSIAVTSGQYLHLIVDQRGIDVAVTLFARDGKTLVDVDSPNGEQGPEPVFVITEADETYRLEVRSLVKTAPAGHYQVNIKELRTATEQDRNRVVAELAFSEAEFLTTQNTRESSQHAIKKYGEILSVIRAAGIGSREGEVLKNIGRNYQFLSENEKAREYYEKSLRIFHDLEDRDGEADALIRIGTVYDSLGYKQIAMDRFNSALTVVLETGNRTLQGAALNNIALIYESRGEKRLAIEYYARSLIHFRDARDRQSEGVALSNLGLLYNSLGEKQLALKSLGEALQIFKDLEDQRGEMKVLNNLGLVYHTLGENLKALDCYTQSLSLYRSTGDRNGEAIALNNIGGVYGSLRERQMALDHYNKALPLYRAVRDRGGEADTLNNIGLTYDIFGEKQNALQYFTKALSLRYAVGDLNGQAVTLNNLMNVYRALGNPRLGIFYGKKSVNIFQQMRSNVRGLDKDLQRNYLKSIEYTYRNLGDLLIEQGRSAEALQVLNAFKDEQFFDFDTTTEKQRKLLDQSSYEEALAFRFDKAIRALESHGNTGKLNHDLRDQPIASNDANQLEQFESQFSAASDEFLAILKRGEADSGQSSSDKNNVRENADTREMQATLRSLQSETGKKAAAIYNLEAGTYYRGLLITPDKIVSFSYPIKVEELRLKEVRFFRQLSEFDKQTQAPKTSEDEIKRMGKELYDVEFAPIALKIERT